MIMLLETQITRWRKVLWKRIGSSCCKSGQFHIWHPAWLSLDEWKLARYFICYFYTCLLTTTDYSTKYWNKNTPICKNTPNCHWQWPGMTMTRLTKILSFPRDNLSKGINLSKFKKIVLSVKWVGAHLLFNWWLNHKWVQPNCHLS